jgi:uncharacterized protein (DUF736 family)
MQIGKLLKRTMDGQDILEGHISTLNMNLKFRLQRNDNKQSENAPDYSIVSNGASGEASIGSVWVKVMNKIGIEQEEFFSMTFDDPSFPHPLNVAAFKVGESHWNIVWRRRQQPEVASTEQSKTH